jgi:hypothetical protein
MLARLASFIHKSVQEFGNVRAFSGLPNFDRANSTALHIDG